MKHFKKPDPVPIFFYSNGLMIKGFTFLPYYSKQAQSILSDILDGYFPYDLKAKYPEGVPLKPVDNCEEAYNIKEIADKAKANKYRQFEDIDGPEPMSKKEFLDQFPKHVMKGGKAIPIREELEKKFQET